jgi:hypothetical protein
MIWNLLNSNSQQGNRQAQSAVKTICAKLNVLGGYVVFDVTDNGEIEKVTPRFDTKSSPSSKAVY